MKTRKQILMLLLVMLAGIPTLSAQTKKEKKEQKKEAVRQLIVSEDYKIDVNTAMPMRGRSIPLTSQYSLQIRNDSVFSYLPYYGRAYSVPYGGGSFASLMRFAISRKREYMADAGSAEMTKNPLALASALRKISDDPDIEAVKRSDVAQLFIQNPGDQSKSALSGLSGLFATHPPIEKRISILEQF